MDELAATTPSSPFVGVTVLVDIVFLLPFSAFSCTGSVSVRNISLYSKLNRLSNHLRFAASSCAAQASKQNKPQKAQFSLFPCGGRVCALHHSDCPTITNVTSLRFAPACSRYLFLPIQRQIHLVEDCAAFSVLLVMNRLWKSSHNQCFPGKRWAERRRRDIM
jgi:hypothetical protein